MKENRIEIRKNKIYQRINKSLLIASISMLTLMPKIASASKIADSKAVKGTEKLVTDLSTVILGLSAGVGALAEGLLYLKLQAASDEEVPSIKKKQKTTLYATIGGALVGTMMKVILAYYK